MFADAFLPKLFGQKEHLCYLCGVLNKAFFDMVKFLKHSWHSAGGSFRTKKTEKTMKKVTAIIERGEDGGFSIYTNDVEGVFGTGMTEEEARNDFNDVMAEQADYYFERTGKQAKWANANVDFKYSIGAFFMAFPFINATQFAQNIGINPSLMRKYKMGLSSASDKQKLTIETQLKELTKKLQHVQLV